MGVALDKLLEYERARTQAWTSAKHVADRIVVAVSNANYLNRFMSMDIDDLEVLVKQLRGEHDKVIEADRNYRQVQREALNG